jgi:trans-2,3-dihydro-3-hydroxyanthranilate isomerase
MPIAAAAACVSLDPALIVTDRHGPVVASVGLPFVVVEVASRRALAAAKPDAAAHDRALPEVGTEGIFLYTRDVGPRAGEVDIEARMFAPRHGVPEDPATGSAAAAAIGLIARVADLDTRTLRVGQGVDMGRPSLILGRVADGRVHVGGASVIVMRGLLAPAQPMGGA